MYRDRVLWRRIRHRLLVAGIRPHPIRPKSSIFSEGPTAILLSVCASVTNSRAWKANARSRLCMRAGLNFGWRLSRGKSDGAVDPE
jgi:hypothetical protein